jgi:hypothetical protein
MYFLKFEFFLFEYIYLLKKKYIFLKEKLSKIKNTNFLFFLEFLCSLFSCLGNFFLAYFLYKKKLGLLSLAEKPIFERVVFLKMWKTGIISLKEGKNQNLHFFVPKVCQKMQNLEKQIKSK